MQAAGRVPTGLVDVQTDSRECIESVNVRATKEYCYLAFHALVSHLQGTTNKFTPAVEDDICPFFVRWEVPRYTSVDLARYRQLTGTRPTGADDDDQSSEVVETQPSDEEVKAQQRARLLRWPLNPTPWLEGDSEDLQDDISEPAVGVQVSAISVDAPVVHHPQILSPGMQRVYPLSPSHPRIVISSIC